MPSSVANERQFRFQSSRSSQASGTSRSPSRSEPGSTPSSCDAVDKALAELQLQSKELLPASSGGKQRSGWQIKASKLSLNTHNRIRNIVESLKISPNPEKPMIPLSIGELTCVEKEVLVVVRK